MKTLVLIRHAKSSWGDPGLPDHDRPLNDRGRRDAPAMGRRLKLRGVVPDAILASTALRATTTAAAVAEALSFDPALVVADARLYAAAPAEVLGIIRGLDDDLACVFLVGHNPEMSELASRLSGGTTYLTTAAVAEFHFDAVAWSEVGSARPTSVLFDSPKDAPKL